MAGALVQIHPDMMFLVHQRGMSSHPSVVAVRDQLHAGFLQHIEKCEVPEPKLTADRDRLLVIAAMDYAIAIAGVLDYPGAQQHIATVVAALLLEAGFEATIDDSNDRE